MNIFLLMCPACGKFLPHKLHAFYFLFLFTHSLHRPCLPKGLPLSIHSANCEFLFRLQLPAFSTRLSKKNTIFAHSRLNLVYVPLFLCKIIDHRNLCIEMACTLFLSAAHMWRNIAPYPSYSTEWAYTLPCTLQNGIPRTWPLASNPLLSSSSRSYLHAMF